MKYLFCFRGCPASGKSTFTHEHSELLKPYTISTDDIRRFFPYMTNVDGSKSTSIYYEANVYDILKTCIEKRMQVNDIVVVDAIHYKKSTIESYKELAYKYGFKIVIVDFYSDVTLEELILRNEKRDRYKRVPIDVLVKMHKVLMNELKTNYDVVTKNEFIDIISNYNVSDTSMLLKDKNLVELIKNKDNILFDIFPILKLELDFDQENKYHPKKLWEHTCDVIDKIPNDIGDDMIYIMALFHDIGKVYTKTKDENGDSHFFNHGGKSCELVRNKIIPILKKYGKYSDNDFERLLIYINYHDLCFGKIVEADRYFEKGFTNKNEIIRFIKFQLADVNSHNIIGKLIGKPELLEQQIEKFKT